MYNDTTILLFSSDAGSYCQAKTLISSKYMDEKTFVIPCKSPFLLSELFHRYKVNAILAFPINIFEIEVLREFQRKYNCNVILARDDNNKDLLKHNYGFITKDFDDLLDIEVLEMVNLVHHETKVLPIDSSPSIFPIKDVLESMLNNEIRLKNRRILHKVETNNAVYIPQELYNTVLHICTELIDNTIKHAEASYISIHLDVNSSSEEISLSYFDNGKGIPKKRFKKNGAGLDMIKSLIQRQSGRYRISSPISRGFSCKVILRTERAMVLQQAA